jgi:hypothetical protein
MTDEAKYTTRRVATMAHEIRSPDGLVIGWAVDEGWAEKMVEGLDRLDARPVPRRFIDATCTKSDCGPLLDTERTAAN